MALVRAAVSDGEDAARVPILDCHRRRAVRVNPTAAQARA